MRARGARLGSAFGRLWAAAAVSNVGPDALRGRVNSGYFLFSVGGAALGALGGGFVARGLGLTAPFWIAFGGMDVLTAVA